MKKVKIGTMVTKLVSLEEIGEIKLYSLFCKEELKSLFEMALINNSSIEMTLVSLMNMKKLSTYIGLKHDKKIKKIMNEEN